jgi:hypothetical protein
MFSLVSVVCCQVQVNASSWSLIEKFLPSVVCLSMFVGSHRAGLGPLELSSHEKKSSIYFVQKCGSTDLN